MAPKKPFAASPADVALTRIRATALALPEAVERLSHGSPSFFIGGKKTFVMFVDDHHGDGHMGIWCAAPPGEQAARIDEDPDVFFRPPYVGGRGWLGVCLDKGLDWDEVATIVEDAYRVVAPKKLLALLDAEPSSMPTPPDAARLMKQTPRP